MCHTDTHQHMKAHSANSKMALTAMAEALLQASLHGDMGM
jgi:hypothetical protein